MPFRDRCTDRLDTRVGPMATPLVPQQHFVKCKFGANEQPSPFNVVILPKYSVCLHLFAKCSLDPVGGPTECAKQWGLEKAKNEAEQFKF